MTSPRRARLAIAVASLLALAGLAFLAGSLPPESDEIRDPARPIRERVVAWALAVGVAGMSVETSLEEIVVLSVACSALLIGWFVVPWLASRDQDAALYPDGSIPDRWPLSLPLYLLAGAIVALGSLALPVHAARLAWRRVRKGRGRLPWVMRRTQPRFLVDTPAAPPAPRSSRRAHGVATTAPKTSSSTAAPESPPKRPRYSGRA